MSLTIPSCLATFASRPPGAVSEARAPRHGRAPASRERRGGACEDRNRGRQRPRPGHGTSQAVPSERGPAAPARPAPSRKAPRPALGVLRVSHKGAPGQSCCRRGGGLAAHPLWLWASGSLLAPDPHMHRILPKSPERAERQPFPPPTPSPQLQVQSIPWGQPSGIRDRERRFRGSPGATSTGHHPTRGHK